MQSYGSHPYYNQQQYNYPAYGPPDPSTYGPSRPSNPYGPQYPYPSYPQQKEPPFIPPPPQGYQPNTPRAKPHRRSASTAAVPLKSALKKTTHPTNEGLTRQATYPAAYTNIPRTRLPSNNLVKYTSDHNSDEFRPLHMFMSFIGNNELRIENIMEPGLLELRSAILPMWPDGVDVDTQHGHDWTVKFRNEPWTLEGPHASKAWAIIVQLFTLFARRGFSFQSTMNFGNPSPRLVFEVTSEDRTSQFFIAYLSRGGRRLTLIKPPTIVDETLGHQLKAVLPRKINEEAVGKDLRVLEVKKTGTGGFEAEPQFFLMHVLKILADLSYNLATGLPLGRKGPFGLRSGKELLVFRGTGNIDAKN